jgi:phosphohistidine phosphatase SixA
VILYFLRHFEATSDGTKLTDAGVAAMRAAGPLWRRLNLRPEGVVSSPLPRAMESARIAAEELRLTPYTAEPVADERLGPGADWDAMARAMADRGDLRSLLFVGHEPDLSRAIALLSGASSVRMRKGSLACVEFYGVPEPGSGELAWLLDPDLYLPEDAE